MNKIEIGDKFSTMVDWMRDNWGGLFEAIHAGVEGIFIPLSSALLFPHPLIMISIFSLIALWICGRGVAIFTVLGMLLIHNLGFWEPTMDTLGLVTTAVMLALLIGIPLGIWTAKSNMVQNTVRPILDFMQTLPAFVYLIPAVLFFQLGEVPGVIATLIFSLPPCVRFTGLGIRQVPSEIREAAISFGSSPSQLLFKAEIPVALPTIMAGINQTIMLALSMVVIAGLIGARGLGKIVVQATQQMRTDLGFEAGISIVILAIFLDRVTQELGKPSKKGSH